MQTVDNMRVENVCKVAHMAPTPTLDLCSIARMTVKMLKQESV